MKYAKEYSTWVKAKKRKTRRYVKLCVREEGKLRISKIPFIITFKKTETIDGYCDER